MLDRDHETGKPAKGTEPSATLGEFAKVPSQAVPVGLTTKPVELIERALRNSSKSRDTVFDPFGGSGPTLIACEKTGRHARLVELEPKYVDVVIRRWQEFTGQKAMLESDGQTFEEAEGERRGIAA